MAAGLIASGAALPSAAVAATGPPTVTATVLPVPVSMERGDYTVTAITSGPIINADLGMTATVTGPGDGYDFLIFDNPSGDGVTWVAHSSIDQYDGDPGTWTASDFNGLWTDDSGFDHYATLATTSPVTFTVVRSLPGVSTKPLLAALDHGRESSSGYARSKFGDWIDADHDGCDTRYEVLISEAVDKPRVTRSCDLRGGYWLSRYDAKTRTKPSALEVDHVVALAEAWESGAKKWNAATRLRYANDLKFKATLIAVTAHSNRSKGRGRIDWSQSVTERAMAGAVTTMILNILDSMIRGPEHEWDRRAIGESAALVLSRTTELSDSPEYRRLRNSLLERGFPIGK